MIKYQNRYKDEYTFTLDSEGNILWEGPFRWMRSGWFNVYDKAYEAYCKDTNTPIPLEDFKRKIHSFDYDSLEYSYLHTKYAHLIYSDTKSISMIDPSGGPYISVGMNMEYIDESFKDMIVEKLERIDSGYKIIIENGLTSNTPS